MTGWHFGSRHRRSASAEAQEQPPNDQTQDHGINRASYAGGTNIHPDGHSQLQTTSVQGYAPPGGVPFGHQVPPLVPNLYPHPPVLDPLAYEQWQLNYALALSANEQAARQQQQQQQATSLLLGIQSQPASVVKVGLSTKGQAEALSYKFWATGRYACLIA